MNFWDLMNAYHINEYESNEYRYKQLVEQIKRQRIVPVFGSGVSCWAGYPSWHEFLQDAALHTYVRKQAYELLEKGQYLECGSLLESEIGYDVLCNMCQYQYNPEKMEEENRPEYQKRIPQLFPHLAISTVVDNSLEKLYRKPFILQPGDEKTINNRILDARLCGRRKQPLILKLYGTVEDSDNMIMTHNQYEHIYGLDSEKHIFTNPFAAEVRRIFEHFFPLFLGCDMNNDRACKTMMTCLSQGGFALLEIPEKIDDSSMDTIAQTGLQAIWYPHGQHECIEILLNQLALDVLMAFNENDEVQEEKKMASQAKQRVFIVHGHDNAAKQEMARTLENAGFEAIILHEQADTGLTIIEKIERYTDVNYAVVLYTECDLGRSKEDPVEKEKNRARQNVVFEHGYLIGKLGRDHVSALVKGNVETPGDISGVVYTKMDEDGAWKMALAKNMKAVGLDVDMNRFCR